MIDMTAPSIDFQRKNLYVRTASFQDVEAIVDVLSRSFQNDPLVNYFRQAEKPLNESDTQLWENNRIFFRLVVKSTLLLKGRVTVVLNPEAPDKETSEGRIVATSCWVPPGTRLSLLTPRVAIKAGLIRCVKAWGLSSLQRSGIEFPSKAHAEMRHCFKLKGDTATDIKDSWYLVMTGTDTSHQGRGCLSLLVREAFAHAPNDIFTLEATSAKSRDQYVHLGYEQPVPITLGKGRVNELGIKERGKKAVGIELYSLAKWPSNGRPSGHH